MTASTIPATTKEGRLSERLATHTPKMRGVLRIMTGLLFLAHGTQKFLYFPAGQGAGYGWTFSGLGAYAGLIELVTGALIALGFFTRPAAFIASGTMAFAYFIGHASQTFWPVNNGGDAAILYSFVFLYLVFAGAGSFSVDALMRRER